MLTKKVKGKVNQRALLHKTTSTRSVDWSTTCLNPIVKMWSAKLTSDCTT